MKQWTREERYRELKDPQELWELHEQTKRSDYRQTFHVQPMTGLINDPNGFVWHNNEWHLFYQWCPWGAVHGLKFWYHTVSKDLITWKNLGLCLIPGKGDACDNKGAYSGSAMPIGDSVYLYYTGNHRDADWTRHPYTCLAKLRDDGWTEKYPLPLFGAHPDYTEHQRDPKIIVNEERGCNYIIVGAQKVVKTEEGADGSFQEAGSSSGSFAGNKEAGTEKKVGCALVYRSEDLLHGWQFEGELKVPGFEDFGDMWECPSIEHIGGKEILMFCPQHLLLPGRGQAKNHNGYILGHMDWDTLTFTPEGQFHVLDFGFDSYAAECANNIQDANKAVLIAWMGLPDSSYPTDEENWQGCLTLPRELTIRGRRLIQQPLPLLKQLRDEEIDLRNRQPGGITPLPRASEMELYIRPCDLEVKLFTNAEGKGGLSIRYSEQEKSITVDRSGMVRRFNTDQGEDRRRPLPNGLTHLRIFIDKSSCEIFVNDGDAVFTTRIFPTREENCFCVRGDAFIRQWTLKPAVRDDFVL